MDRCRIDEPFRLNCVVMPPIYDVRLTGWRALIKYHNFIRPMPGVVLAIMPRLAISEALRVARTNAGGDGLVLISLRFDRETLKTLTLGFNRPLPEGRWAVLLDGHEVDGARFEQPAAGSGEEARITFGEPQAWLRSPGLLFRIDVRETVSGWTAGFLLPASRVAPSSA